MHVFRKLKFDSLNRGDNYINIKPAHHIGILDFTLSGKTPEFYATYQILNIKNFQKYTDKFTLSVVCLPYIDKATDKDRDSHLVDWAAMFKATQWEELRMLAQKNPNIDNAITSVYSLYQDDNIREQMIRREEYFAHERYIQRTLASQQKALTEQAKALSEKDKVLSEKDKLIAELKAQLEAKR